LKHLDGKLKAAVLVEKRGKLMKNIVLVAVVSLSALVAGTAVAQSINAAGATFPAPIYQKWFGDYKTAHPSIQINYQAIGSGGGIKQLTEGTVDFGASDKPMSDAEIAAVKVKPLHFPTVLGGVVLVYNIPGVETGLKLSGDTIAGIYLGDIRKWNDAKLKADNPKAALPDHDIVVVHRTDGSGTSFVFTDYLSQVSAGWKKKVGANTAVQWPAGMGLGAKGNDGIAGTIKQQPFSIGYVELLFAVQNKMKFADVKNSAGQFVTASFATVTAAAAASKGLEKDFRGSVVNAPGATSYPISTYTWLLIPSHIPDAGKKKAITEFLKWMLTDGQKDAQALSYAQLPKNVIALELKQIAEIR
jgi:phosphate transport system substrate-binding protein